MDNRYIILWDYISVLFFCVTGAYKKYKNGARHSEGLCLAACGFKGVFNDPRKAEKKPPKRHCFVESDRVNLSDL